LRRRREKVFGDGRPRPLDRNAKARVMTLARALMRRTEKGKAYGPVTAKAPAVLEALLWGFHNARSGLCFPSYEKFAERAGCARSTVAEAIKALEDAGLLTWVNRLKRVRERRQDLFGPSGSLVRVLRTSNGYRFNDPKGAAERGFASKSYFPSGTPAARAMLYAFAFASVGAARFDLTWCPTGRRQCAPSSAEPREGRYPCHVLPDSAKSAYPAHLAGARRGNVVI
jgi:AraC-like DNA-binding protein